MANNRRKKLAMNTVTSFLLQITQFISGFILPRLILDVLGLALFVYFNKMIELTK